MRPTISSHLTYYLRASNPHLETLNEEDVNILLHYILKHCCPDIEEDGSMAQDEWRETNLTIRFCNLKYWKK